MVWAVNKLVGIHICGAPILFYGARCFAAAPSLSMIAPVVVGAFDNCFPVARRACLDLLRSMLLFVGTRPKSVSQRSRDGRMSFHHKRPMVDYARHIMSHVDVQTAVSMCAGRAHKS